MLRPIPIIIERSMRFATFLPQLVRATGDLLGFGSGMSRRALAGLLCVTFVHIAIQNLPLSFFHSALRDVLQRVPVFVNSPILQFDRNCNTTWRDRRSSPRSQQGRNHLPAHFVNACTSPPGPFWPEPAARRSSRSGCQRPTGCAGDSYCRQSSHFSIFKTEDVKA